MELTNEQRHEHAIAASMRSNIEKLAAERANECNKCHARALYYSSFSLNPNKRTCDRCGNEQ